MILKIFKFGKVEQTRFDKIYLIFDVYDGIIVIFIMVLCMLK